MQFTLPRGTTTVWGRDISATAKNVLRRSVRARGTRVTRAALSSFSFLPSRYRFRPLRRAGKRRCLGMFIVPRDIAAGHPLAAGYIMLPRDILGRLVPSGSVSRPYREYKVAISRSGIAGASAVSSTRKVPLGRGQVEECSRVYRDAPRTCECERTRTHRRESQTHTVA